jgi:hypothetical protein
MKMLDLNTQNTKALNKENLSQFALSSSEMLKNKLCGFSSNFETDLFLIKFSMTYENFCQNVLSLKQNIDSNGETSSDINNLIDFLLSNAQSRSKSSDRPNIKKSNLNQNYRDIINDVFLN